MPPAFRRTFLALLAICASLSATPTLADPPKLLVFAAASLKNALDDVDAAYAKQSGVTPGASYAASSVLARQIEQGAPADVFVSADVDWMDYLAKRKLIATESRRALLTNHLALIAGATSTTRLTIRKGFPLAQTLGAGGRLAVAGPDVPAGKYGRASLQALGVWDSVKDQLAPAQNVRGALAFVAQGEAPLGIVYDTDAKAEPKVRIVGLFPDSSHPPIVYPIAITTGSHSPAATGYVAFLESSKGAAIFRKYGFVVLPAR